MGGYNNLKHHESLIKINAVVITLLIMGMSILALSPVVCAQSDGTFNPPHSDYGMDTDSNTLYNYLVVNVSISVTSPGDFLIVGELTDNSGLTTITTTMNMSTLTVGNHVVAIWFTGYDIYNSGINGPYQAQLMLFPDMGMDSDVHFTNLYLYTDFDPPPALFSPPHYDYGLDTDNPINGLYNYLVVNANISVTSSGTYEVIGTLVDSLFNFIESISNTTVLNAGLQTVELRFSGPSIYANGVDGPYDVFLDLYDDDSNMLDTDTHVTNPYLYTDFDLPPATLSSPHYDYGLDTDNPQDGLFDYLIVSVNISVITAGTYEIEGALLDTFSSFIDDDSNNTFLETGLQTVDLRFYGPLIFINGEDGPYDVDITLFDNDYNQLDFDIHFTNFYSYSDFDQPPITFASPHYDYGLDTDNPANGLFNYLVVNVNVSVTEAGTFHIFGALVDGSFNLVTLDINTTTLGPGFHTIELRFYGPAIYTYDLDGPYNVALQLTDSSDNELGFDIYSTNPYLWTDFDPPPVTLSPPYLDFGLDTDSPANGLYDYLVINVSLNVTSAGNFTLISVLYDDMQSIRIVGASNSTYLTPGNQTVGLYHQGWVIGIMEIEGPFSAEIMLYDEDMNLMEMGSHLTNSYLYSEFETTLPYIVSKWTSSSPTIDGVFSPGEWADAVWVDLLSIEGNMINASLFLKNDAENLYICYDAVGDTTLEPDDGASVSFDTANDDQATNRREDQFVVGEMDNNQAHHVYSTGAGTWVVEDSPFDNSRVNHGTLMADWGFGTSDNSSTDHRIYEFQIPLALIGTALGDTVGFAGVSVPKGGVMDGMYSYSLWPAYFAGPPPLRVYGNLTLAPSPGGNVPPTLKEGRVTPQSGATDSTYFSYQVTYRDADNDAPQSPCLWINKSSVPVGGPYPMTFKKWVGDPGSYVSGAIYTFKGTLADYGSDYTFTFNASDGSIDVFGTEQPGPIVLALPNPPLNLGVQGFAYGTVDSLNITDHTPELNWTFFDPDSAVQDGYNVTVWTAPNGTGTLMWWDNLTSSSSAVTFNYDGNAMPLLDGTDYYLRIRTKDGDDLWGDWAEMMFHMNSLPQPPNNANPLFDAHLLPDPSQEVLWEIVMDSEGSPVTYYWYVSLDPSFTALYASGNTIDLNSSQFTTSSGNTYYWRVRAYDSYEFGANSTTWSFNVSNPPGSPVNLGVQSFSAGTPESMNITNHSPELNWTFTDPDGDTQGGYNITICTAPGGTGTLIWWANQTGSSTNTVYGGPGLIDGENYYLRVKTKDEWGFWNGWSEMMFHMNTPPPAPVNDAPLNGISVSENTTQTIQWGSIVDSEGSAVTYYWYVSLDPSFSTLYQSGFTMNLNSTPFQTSQGNTYYWRVRAFDSYEFGSNGTTWSFNISNLSNTPFNLGVQGYAVGSSGSMNITDAAPELNWTFSDSDGDTQGGYNVTVWTGPGGTGTLIWWYNQTGTQTNVVYGGSGLTDGEDYYLRIKTMDENGFWGGWADMKFHMNTPPSAPTNDAPSDGAYVSQSSIQTVQWESIADSEGSAVTYHWYVSPDSSFSTFVDSGTTSGLTSSQFTTSAGSTYYWRVRAYDGYELGPNSTTWNFTVSNPPDPPLNLGVEGFSSGPPGSLNIIEHTPEFNWTFMDPDGDTQGGFNATVWTGTGGTGTLIWRSNRTGSSTDVIFSGLELIDGEDYYLRVKTMDETGLWSDWAEMRFHMNAIPPAPVLETPDNGAAELDFGLQELNWNPVIDFEGSTVNYEWVASLAESFSEILTNGTVSENTASFVSSSSAKYYWRVRAYDGYEWSEYSTAWNFTTTHPKGSISGTVMDEDGSPVEDVKLELYDSSDNLMTEAYTDSNGQFAMQDVAPGTGYYLLTSKDRFENHTSDPFTVSEEQNTNLPNIQIQRISEKGTISGTVKDEDGEPIANAKLNLLDPEGNTIDTAFTDNIGDFEFEYVEPGNYNIWISKDGFKGHTSNEISVGAGEEKTVPSFGLEKETEEPFPWWIVSLIAIIAIVLIAVVFLVFKKKKKEPPLEEETPPEDIPEETGL